MLNVAPLLRELILHAVERAPLHADRPQEARIIDMILDQLEALPAAPLRRARAARSARAARRRVAARTTLPTARASSGSRGARARASARSSAVPARDRHELRRLAPAVRLMQALELLAAGEPVTSVALAVGYESTSAFIARFREVLGTTPGRYYNA